MMLFISKILYTQNMSTSTKFMKQNEHKYQINENNKRGAKRDHDKIFEAKSLTNESPHA